MMQALEFIYLVELAARVVLFILELIFLCFGGFLVDFGLSLVCCKLTLPLSRQKDQENRQWPPPANANIHFHCKTGI